MNVLIMMILFHRPMAEANAKKGALASHGKRRKKKEKKRKEDDNRKKNTHQRGEIYDYIDHGDCLLAVRAPN